MAPSCDIRQEYISSDCDVASDDKQKLKAQSLVLGLPFDEDINKDSCQVGTEHPELKKPAPKYADLLFVALLKRADGDEVGLVASYPATHKLCTAKLCTWLLFSTAKAACTHQRGMLTNFGTDGHRSYAKSHRILLGMEAPDVTEACGVEWRTMPSPVPSYWPFGAFMIKNTVTGKENLLSGSYDPGHLLNRLAWHARSPLKSILIGQLSVNMVYGLYRGLSPAHLAGRDVQSARESAAFFPGDSLQEGKYPRHDYSLL